MTLRSAAITFVAGWSLFWSTAMHITASVPLWLPLLILIGGLLMIPAALRRAQPAAELNFVEAPAATSPSTAVELER